MNIEFCSQCYQYNKKKWNVIEKQAKESI